MPTLAELPPLAGWTRWITGQAGKSPAFDWVMSLVASDFFIPVIVSLILLALWVGVSDRAKRDAQHRAIMAASVGIGITNLVVQLINRVHFWPRPFADEITDTALRESAKHAANIVFYLPHDPSFPSNAAAVSFAAATGVWLWNKKAGAVLYALATLYAFSRFYAGIHFFLDVFGGAVIGSIVAYLISKYFMPLTRPVQDICLRVGRFFYLA